ncbi:carbohydrate kinase family protein [Cohnella rhizosphaerae]|uniref:Sugar kinase n=1 Tax=Cohnella rhizosphaerae TaxID=1457232 RepID=A0A9X4QUP2_9BACL|nr:sugar kinase [Cohnella rhizosphaerae]MDG0811709.1 sugar kinase [Cohnella rhizosphaerae]
MLDLNRSLAMSAGEYDLLTVGELLVDLISAEYGDHHDASVYHKYFGGSPANIAMNANKLGIRPQLAAAVGADGLGKALIRQVRAAGIEPALIETVEHATSLVLVTKSRSTPVPIFYRGADYRLSFSPGLERSLRQSKMMHFSSWPISMQPSRGTIERMVEIARANGIWIGFDPNYHPMLWPKEEDGVGYIKAMIGKADIVKPSDDDAERLFGKDSPDNHIRRFLDLGAKLVILTLGKDGALVSNGKETIRFPSLAAEVEDTTGAGDAFWSGLYAALAQGCVLREAIRTGLAASAFKLKYTGALADLPRLDELKARYGI